MPTITTTKSVVLSTPVLDDKGKPQTEKVKFGNREVTHNILDHVQHPAGAVLDVDAATAKMLIAEGHARPAVAGIEDDEIDPTKVDPALA